MSIEMSRVFDVGSSFIIFDVCLKKLDEIHG